MAKIHINNPKQVINGGAKKYYFKVKGLGGPKGDKGDTGATGPQGPQGNAATISIGSTTTLPVGNDATVTNSGSIYNAVLNFGIPQGPRGPQGATGATGAKGDKGDKGDQGNPGPQGEKGTNATVTVGTTTTTEPGTQAYAWNSSSSPNNAVINFNIPRGATGPQGPQGIQGADGQDGQNFTPTIVDTLPAVGDQGNLYLTPKNYTTGTATGNPITISLGEDEGAIDSFKLDGDTFQQSYTGKNLWGGFLSDFSRTSQGVSYTNKADGVILANGTSSGLAFSLLSAEAISSGRIITLQAGNYVLSGGSSTVSLQVISSSGGQIAETASNGVKAFTLSGATDIFVRAKMVSGAVANNVTIKPMLEAGSTATSYEPYVGGQPSPNPDYPQQIQTVTGEQTVEIVGKNLAPPLDRYTYSCNSSATIDSQSNGTVVFSTSTSSASSGVYIYKTIGNNATLCPELFTAGYTVSFDVVATATCSFEFGVTGNRTATTISTTKQRVSVATATGAGIVFYNNSRNGATITISNIQVEAGSSATSFEPYHTPTSYPISLGSLELCKLGSYQDYIWKDGEDWKVHKATVSAIIDGSESWGTSGTNTFYVANIYSKIGNSIQSTSTGEMYASHFTIVDITSSNTLVGASLKVDAAQNVSNLRIRLQDMSGGVAGFRQMLSAKKPSIYARRLTPTDITITDTNLIAQLEAIRTASLENGTNTITNTATGTNLAGDMEFDYYEYDPTNRYDKWLWLDLNNAYEEFNEEGGGGGGGSITVDSALSTTSKNPVQNKVVTAAINSKVDSSSLATVATSGSYNDLSNKPTIPTIPTHTSAFTNNGSDGTSTYVEADELATVATTGAYSDLSGTPTIPTATSDLTNDSGFITSADLPTKTSDLTNDGSDGTSTYVEASGLATVATSGSYNDLSNKPTIPTVNNGTLTIRQNGKTLGTFTANQSTNTTVNLTDNSSYSTSEVKTSATWINGKPIYKKTFSFTLADAESTTINHGISNFGLLIKFEGTVVQSSTKNVPIPRTLTATNYQVGLEGVTDTSFEIDVGASGPRGKQAYMTLWYTKTTD